MTTRAANGDQGGMVLTGTTMELAGTPGPATVISDVALELSRDGVTVTASGNAPAAVAWSALAGARCGEPGVMPDGAPAVAVSALVAGRFVRWLVPSSQIGPERAMAIDLLLASRTGRTGGLPAHAARTQGPVPPAPAHTGAGEGEVAAPRAPAHAAAEEVVAPLFAAPAAPAPGAPAPAHPAPAPAPTHAAPDPGAGATSPPPTTPAVVSPVEAAPEAAPEAPAGGSRLARVLWALIVLLVLGGAALLGLGLTSSTPWASGSGVVVPDRALALAVNLVRTNLPTGWTVARTPNGPLSGFVGGTGSSGGGIGSRTPEDRTIARLYEQCVGVPAARDAVMGASGPSPAAHASSPPFAAPAGRSPMQAASLVDVYRSGAVVQQGAAQIGRSRFAPCFGQAIGKVFRQSAQASSKGSSVTYGTPTVVRLRLPAVAGVCAAGADVDLPLEFTGATVTVQLGFVFVAGGRIEATLVTFSEASGFPPSLARQLAGVVEHNIAGTAGV